MTAFSRLFTVCAVFLFSVSICNGQDNPPLPAPGQRNPIDIPYESFTLDNGLTVIVHEDRKAPIVAVNVWYHVGSKNEKMGKTGFAHLFEHLMFNGSENFNDDYFRVLEDIGATNLNGTTNRDRTNYFQNVPVNALDQALWMESDRMGHMLGAVDQERLDEQRGVVQNEKRQGENQPYGKTNNVIVENTYPPGHPYSWSVIGSMDDLNAASLDDVHQWFKDYYGPNNAVLVIAGDIDVVTAREKVETYFGDISPGTPITKQDTWIAKMSGAHRTVMEDRVPLSRVYKVWNVPEWGNPERDHLQLAASVLARGKTSRLYRRLIYDNQLASSVNAFVRTGEISSQFRIVATVQPGVDLATVEAAVDDELDRFLTEGPNSSELDRVKSQYYAGFVRGLEQIGGFGGKSDVLAQNQVYGMSPDAYKSRLENIQSATTQEVHQASQKWLSDGEFALEVHPFAELSAAKEGADRSRLPDLGTPPNSEFPAFSRHTLSNGLDVMIASRTSLPVVSMSMQINAGYAADQSAAPGTAQLTLSMLDEGTASKNALEISEDLALLGATLGTGSNVDMSSVSMSALRENLDASLELFADVILEPAFPQTDFERLQQLQLVAIKQEKQNPVAMMLRVFPALMYGEDHAYGLPFTGSGTEQSVSALTRDDLLKFHSEWFKPNNATLILVGDVTADEILPKLENVFGSWETGTVPVKNISEVPLPDEPIVYIMDRPGAIQSIIVGGHVAVPKANPDEIAIGTVNTVLGGAFISRINMNLREDKGWSYGAFAVLIDARGQRPFFLFAPVQTDKTSESMMEMSAELNGILTDNLIRDDEVDRAKNSQVLTLPGQWETNIAVRNSLSQINRFGYADNYFDSFASDVRSLSTDDVNTAAPKLIHPGNLMWIVVGDRAVIEDGIRALGYGTIRYLDADGNEID